MNIEELQMTIADLTGVEPRSIASDTQAKEAAAWVSLGKQAEEQVNEFCDPGIKQLYNMHKKMVGEKKSLLEKLLAAKDRVRMGLANWIAAGHSVDGCYTKTKYRVTVDDVSLLPAEYQMTVANMPELEKWVAITEGQQPVPGCTIEPVHVLYAKAEGKV